MTTVYAVRGVLGSRRICDARQLFARNAVFMNIFCAARVLFQFSLLAFACSIPVLFANNILSLLPHEEAPLSNYRQIFSVQLSRHSFERVGNKDRLEHESKFIIILSKFPI